MKKITLALFLLFLCKGFSQSLPLDFESSTTTYAFTDFDGGVATRIPNPQVSGINTSAHVIQLVKGPGAVWAGSKIVMPTPIDLSTDRVFKVKVFSPVAGIRLLLKFEGSGPFVFQKESSPITTANVWEELTFDFSADAVNNLNNELVFIFDNGTQGDGGPNSTYLFDDVTQSAGGPILDLPELPLDFESTSLAYPFTDFAGAETSIIPNPFPGGINTSSTVVKMIKNVGETYAGSVIQMAGPIDFSSNKIVTVKVWSPVAGKKLLLKFEGSPVDYDNGAFETDATITKANEWEELTFDYTSPTLFPPVNNNDNKIVFFFDFGNQGDGSVNSTYYFDDVAFSEVLSSSSFETSKVRMYPNPATEQLSIEAHGVIETVSFYSLLGQEVFKTKPKGHNVTIPTSTLKAGVYIVKTTIEGKEAISKFVKK